MLFPELSTTAATLIILAFFLTHWFTSAFAQTFFLHRYSAHNMFAMNRFWERFFYLFTAISQGSSYLNPRAYAILHRMHHSYSDTEKDPHSPHFFKDVFQMMWQTKKIYQDLVNNRIEPEPRFDTNYASWHALDRIADHVVVRLGWVLVYTAFYVAIAPSAWFYLLLPVHYLMGPVHGAGVNWCGHKYGYRNYDLRDHSKNTFNCDIFFMGELFQNNHHKYPTRPKFATRWFEIDAGYTIIRLLAFANIIKLNQKAFRNS